MNLFALQYFGQCFCKVWHTENHRSWSCEYDVSILFHPLLRPIIIGEVHDFLRRSTTFNWGSWLRKDRIAAFELLHFFPNRLRVGVV